MRDANRINRVGEEEMNHTLFDDDDDVFSVECNYSNGRATEREKKDEKKANVINSTFTHDKMRRTKHYLRVHTVPLRWCKR